MSASRLSASRTTPAPPGRVVTRPVDRPAESTTRPPLLVVPPLVRRRRAGVAAAVLFAVLFGALFGLVAFQAKLASDQRQLDALRRATADAEREYKTLRVQLAELEAPQNVVAAARGFGLVPPSDTRHLTPSVADVAAVTAATGETSADATSAARIAEWSATKPLIGSAP